jgi:hypothetical protein
MAALPIGACVDEERILAQLRQRLCALPPAALAERLAASGQTMRAPDGGMLADPRLHPDLSSDADGELRERLCDDMLNYMLSAPQAVGQYSLGCALQGQHIARGGSFGSALQCEEEARAWFLLAARHGHAAAHEAVGAYFLSHPSLAAGEFALEGSYHDAFFYFWAAIRKGYDVGTTARLTALVSIATQDHFLPLATKVVPAGAQLSAVARQYMVALLHLGPRLADAS